MRVRSQLVDYCKLEGIDPLQSYPQQAFIQLVRRDRLPQSPLLDIGAGAGRNSIIRKILGDEILIDGVDSDPSVLDNSDLRKRWHAPFETAPISSHSYDFSTAYNVVEHIQHPQQFLSKLANVLRPGGVFWAYTPNAYHPFSLLSRSIEVMGGKQRFAARNEWVNDYPAYYRLNCVRSVLRAARGLPFEEANFYHLYAPGWQNYFPRRLRWLPRAWDAVTCKRSTAVLAFRLQRSAN